MPVTGRRLRAVILAGGPGTANLPLANAFPLLTFPSADGRPMIEHLLAFLARNGVHDVAVSLSSHGDSHQAIVEVVKRYADPSLRLTWSVDQGFRGTAGPLKDLSHFIDDDPFVVLSPNLWPDGLDLRGMLAEHERNGAAATVAIQPQPCESRGLENIALTSGGRIKEFRLMHQAGDRRRERRPAGVYLFEPDVLDAIDPDGYVDIKEQLVPALRERNLPVYAHVLDRPAQQIETLEDYFVLCRRVLIEQWSRHSATEPDRAACDDGIVIGDNADISPDAILVGPLTIGDDCSIGAGARVVGPSVICSNTRIESDVLVRESILWRDCKVESGARVEYCVATAGCRISRGQHVMSTVLARDAVWNRGFNATTSPGAPVPKRRRTQDHRVLRRALRFGRRACYRAGKRLMDISVAVVLLLLLLPVFILLAIAIKLDSRGPVLFGQIRCSIRGRPFRMYKFRTMVDKSEHMQQQLHGERDIQGPMFKMHRDPRVTRLGHLLRRASLDELAQLWNVLKGDMSLVGPRPLALNEMAWSTKWRDMRLMVKPGITGLWQVNARDDPAFNGWLENDLAYVENQSLLVDLRILMKTAQAVINRSATQ